MREILDKIRSLRVSKGYSQEYIAEKLGIDTVNYGRIERGQSKLTMERFLKICEILEVEPVEFFTQSDSKVLKYLENIYNVEKQILDVLKKSNKL